MNYKCASILITTTRVSICCIVRVASSLWILLGWRTVITRVWGALIVGMLHTSSVVTALIYAWRGMLLAWTSVLWGWRCINTVWLKHVRIVLRLNPLVLWWRRDAKLTIVLILCRTKFLRLSRAFLNSKLVIALSGSVCCVKLWGRQIWRRRHDFCEIFFLYHKVINSSDNDY